METFNELYAEVDGYKIYFAGKDAIPQEEAENLIYGESLFEELVKIFNYEEISGFIKNAKNFYDLGSGTGRVVVGAALICKHLEKAIGIELLSTLYETSRDIKKELIKIDKGAGKKIEFVNENFLNIDFSQLKFPPDIIFLHFPLRSEGCFPALEQKFINELRPGTLLISITRRLSNSDEFPEVAPSMSVTANYGEVTAYFHKKS